MQERPTVVVTGATSGLGKIVSIELARRGIRLVLTARNAERAASLEVEIRQVQPDAEIRFHFGDLSQLADAERIGQEIAASCHHIDVLINNAGLHGFEQRITKEGLPEMVAVNYLAPWVLTRELGPRLGAHGKSRVVFVASEAAKNHGVFDLTHDLVDTTAFTATGSSAVYGKSKLLDLMLTRELARLWQDLPVTVYAVCPGFNVTGLGRELGFSKVLSRILKTFKIGDPNKGAAVILAAALGPTVATSGTFFTARTGGETPFPAPAGDSTLERQLWRETESLVKKVLDRRVL